MLEKQASDILNPHVMQWSCPVLGLGFCICAVLEKQASDIIIPHVM
jgi:hypothetical protein